jgi:hypothetical protein
VLTEKKVTFRDGPHVKDTAILVPDFEFPTKDKLCYENHIIGFV